MVTYTVNAIATCAQNLRTVTIGDELRDAAEMADTARMPAEISRFDGRAVELY